MPSSREQALRIARKSKRVRSALEDRAENLIKLTRNEIIEGDHIDTGQLLREMRVESSPEDNEVKAVFSREHVKSIEYGHWAVNGTWVEGIGVIQKATTKMKNGGR